MPKEIISDREAQRRAAQSKRDRERLLYDRAETGHLLGGVSTSTLIRLEQSGLLVAVKPSGRANGKTFYTSQSVHRLAGCEQVTEVA
jgi:hypothetical protein